MSLPCVHADEMSDSGGPARSESSVVRRSQRNRKLTEKGEELLQSQIDRRVRKFNDSYCNWKRYAKESRTKLKLELSSGEQERLLEDLQTIYEAFLECYDDLRGIRTPTRDEVQKADCVTQITQDIREVVEKNSTAVFNKELSRMNVRTILCKDVNPSIFGETNTEVLDSQYCRSEHHETTYRSNKTESYVSQSHSLQSEAAVELAEKKAQLEGLHNIHNQQRKIREEEERLELLRAQECVKIAQAKVEALDEGANNTSLFKMNRPTTVKRDAHPSSADHDLVHLFNQTLSTNRLPVPEPSVFSGDPLQFAEWKESFQILIESKCSSQAEKLFYLKRYTSGDAANVIKGAFLRTDSSAYDDAMKRLSTRYGDAFLIQRAYREKIANWPKIHDKDAKALQDFSDFLFTCKDAIPQIKGLEILNDCEENRKIMDKLPNWVRTKWNRIVTSSLKTSQNFPSFADFVEFLSDESDVANNPIFKSTGSGSSSSKVVSSDYNAKNAKSASKVFSLKVDPSVSSTKSCSACSKNHSIENCFKFKNMKIEERRTFVKDQQLCFGCLGVGHRSKYCKQRATCTKCGKRHPTLIHLDRVESEVSSPTKKNDVPAVASSVSCYTNQNSTLTSMIVPVFVSSDDRPGEEFMTYAMLDTQSDSSFVSSSLENVLGLKGDEVRLKLSTMASNAMIVDCHVIKDLKIRGLNSRETLTVPKLYTKDVIPADRNAVPTPNTAKAWPHLQTIANEIPPLQNCEIGLLIGYNCPQALTPRQVICGNGEQPFAVKTDLGWSIVGGQSRESVFCHRVSIKEVPILGREVLSVLESDFKLEKEEKVSQEDRHFMKIMEEEKCQLNNGHLQLPLPFKSRPALPNNRSLAEKRLEYLRKRFLKNEQFRSDYTAFMEDVIGKNDAEISIDTKDGESWYIPHHGVYHPKKPGKIRVVFDCSSKFAGTSLNDHLLSGPDLTNNMIGVLCRFREDKIALTCDVERMFHQFLVRPEDRGYLKFLWWPGGDIDLTPVEYRMRVHLFGASSSPGCANFGLKHLASVHMDDLKLGAEFILHNFYVDDGICSTHSVDEAVQIANEARQICKSGGLRLHKFCSNSKDVLSALPLEDLSSDLQQVDLHTDVLPLSSTLGVQWDINDDSFSFKMAKKDDNLMNRRHVLSMVASIYDPLGFLAPFILCGKGILQVMCRNGISWDEELPVELIPKWKNWLSDFMQISEIRIPRCLIPPLFADVREIELHHFSDASTIGYGQCSYVRLIGMDNRIHCTLLIGKSRVAPTKVTTIPRLELTAAVLSVKVSQMLKSELNLVPRKEVFWTDSKVVLGYISNDSRRFQMFVANRIQAIREHSQPSQWMYVDSSSNPADHASRGLTASELISSNWYSGPEFLWNAEISCSAIDEVILSKEDPEVKRSAVFNTVTSENSTLLACIKKFSEWLPLVRAIARLQRRANGLISSLPASVSEMESATLHILRIVQQDEIDESDLPRSLNPVTDKNSIIRVGGRLQQSSLSFELRCPVILKKDSHTALLLVRHFHEKVMHQGRGITMNELRSNGYWIIGASRLVSSVINSCVTCRKLRRPTESQMMSELPRDRVEPAPPFTFCGMDCFGPFVTKNGRKENKRYGVLFTCCCSRAIHIEMIDDMTTDSFINALRSFIAIRGKVKQIRCDRGSNFVGAKSELKTTLEENFDNVHVKAYLRDQNCEFVFNVPHASHMGGMWERQIRTVRSILSSVVDLQSGRLDDSSLRTLFYEAMAIVNNRPLSTEFLSSPEIEPLTPNHILTMKGSIAPSPPSNFVQSDLYLRKKWRRVQYLSEQFWSRWRKEYLQSQNVRKIWSRQKRNMKIGDVVLLDEPEAKRNEWPMGRVIELFPSSDGFVRKVKVRILRNDAVKTLDRPIHKLVLLVESES